MFGHYIGPWLASRAHSFSSPTPSNMSGNGGRGNGMARLFPSFPYKYSIPRDCYLLSPPTRNDMGNEDEKKTHIPFFPFLYLS